ncbi:OmpA family protein [Marinobacter daqiaonensis]|uniref:OmpA family protein n=1 Tax=Marinobacter daqiaonensis TaxID=650891 RepID=A0A1I6JIS4_9GAMM|nr:OmpA family protein [Marinobacter daqiaonensis]SFR78540.1 OmpA family protein [Marinobacter daqiaonensis]
MARNTLSTHRSPRRSLVKGCMLLALSTWVWNGQGQASTFGAGLENSDWYLSASVFDCTLTHQVPGYGRAVFTHRAGESLSFYLESDVVLMRPGRGLLMVEAPSWRPGEPTRRVGYVDISDARKSVQVGEREAMEMVQGLLSGMAPTLTRQARYADGPVRVRLSNINFRSEYEGYRSCVTGLLPVNYDQIQRSRIPFASGSTSLSDRDRELLDRIVTYVQADSEVGRVFVDGHSDGIGSRIQNRALSEERAQVVADYLISAGLPEDKIIVRSHADQYPVSRNPADNRRTTIRLEREGERPTLQRAGNARGPGTSG